MSKVLRPTFVAYSCIIKQVTSCKGDRKKNKWKAESKTLP